MSSSSDDLFTFAPASVPAFQPLPEAAVAEPRAIRRADAGSHKRSRVIVLDEDEEETAAPRPAPAAKPAAKSQAADDWLLPPPPVSSRAAVQLTEAEQALLRRNKQALEELQRPVPDEPEPEAAPSSRVQEAPVSAALTIFLRDASGKKQQFKVRGNTKFAQVFDAYCESTGRERASANFTFDGDEVRPDATPGDLDMEDDDVIDVK